MQERLFRNPNGTVIGWGVIGMIVGGLVVVAFVVPDVSWAAVLVAGIVAALLAAGAYRVYLRPRLLLAATGVTVVNPGRITRLAWADIELFAARFQLEVRRREGRTVQVWAVPGRGGLGRRRGENRAATAAEELNRYLGDEGAHRPGAGADFSLTSRERLALAASAAVLALTVVAGALARALQHR